MSAFIKLFILITFLASSNSSFALGWFSRACRWSDIPAVAHDATKVLFARISDEDNYDILERAWRASAKDQRKFLIFESITADYGETRYFLFAQAKAYYWSTWDRHWRSSPGSLTRAAWYHAQDYPPSDWIARAVPPEATRDMRLQIFYHNRQRLYSARSGNPRLLEEAGVDIIDAERYRVLGTHSYYEPKNRALVNLGQSVATDCNLAHWGIETFGQYR